MQKGFKDLFSQDITGLPDGEWAAPGVFVTENRTTIAGFDAKNSVKELEHLGAAMEPVFLDIETTGLSGGRDLFFMAGVGRPVGETLVVRQYFLTDPHCEKIFLQVFGEAIPGNAGFVSYNGKSFDLPFIASRMRTASVRKTWRQTGHLDLLEMARRLWRGRIPNCRLGTVESEILGVVRDGEDVPGRDIPQLYVRYLDKGDASMLRGVFYHNLVDITSLARMQMRVALEFCGGKA